MFLDRNDFKVHLKYASRLAKLSSNLSVKCNEKPKISKGDLGKITDKTKLIALTKQSVEDELKIVRIDADYSTASILWLPIKTYYLSYHLLSIIDYILTGVQKNLRKGHSDCIGSFTRRLESGSLVFSEPLLNTTHDKGILSFRSVSGEILKTSISDDRVYKLLMKKVAEDKVKEYMSRNGIPDLKRMVNRQKVNNFKQSITVSVFDFFYLMRLRFNYKNFNFIENIPSSYTKNYFEEYYVAANNFYVCFDRLRNKIIQRI